MDGRTFDASGVGRSKADPVMATVTKLSAMPKEQKQAELERLIALAQAQLENNE